MTTSIKLASEQIIERLEHAIKQKQQTIRVASMLPIDEISALWPQGTWGSDIIDRFEFTLPYDFELIREVERVLRERYPQYKLASQNQYVWDSGSAGQFLRYRIESDKAYFDNHMMLEFCVAFRTSREGSTCTLNQIGTRETPVYEVVCKEGASDGTFTPAAENESPVEQD